jgi:hypothetical protein
MLGPCDAAAAVDLACRAVPHHSDANMMFLYLVATNMGDNRAEEGRWS